MTVALNYPHALLGLCESGDITPDRASRLFVQTLSSLDRRFATPRAAAELQAVFSTVFGARVADRISRGAAIEALIEALALAESNASDVAAQRNAGKMRA